jgi:hypothetical protein
MIAGTIWTQLVDTLNGNPTLSKYIKYVFEGRRYDIEPDSLPCIMLEPSSNNEVLKEMNNIKDIYFNVDVFAFSSANFQKYDKTIVGDDNYKGILDMENDLRACLQSSYDLGGRVIDIRFDPTLFDQLDIGKYPVRGMLMPIKILYRQVNNE